jgi:hypothetical protein
MGVARQQVPDWRRVAAGGRVRGAALGLALSLMVLVSLSWHAPAQAQGGGWSEPYQLSSLYGRASEADCVADQYGYVHCFWVETLFADQRTIIQYARFDGATWTTPNAIYVTGQSIRNVSPVVDQLGTLHIVWAEGMTGPAFYTYAPANNALSARSWAPPARIDIPARTLSLRMDSTGGMHIVFINQVEDPGVYYVRSDDQWQTWSEPAWLDPDIPPNYVPDSLNFHLDETDGLHVVWFYGALAQADDADWVRYTHSLDGGRTWSAPFTIDHSNPAADYSLTAASPVMLVHGQTVDVIWAAGPAYRHHRFSRDAGQTWSETQQIFGQLTGQAFDGLAADGAGRVHFLGQIRYPQGIYHAYWDQTQWTTPEMVYFILRGDTPGETIGDRIHAHFLRPVVRSGNQLLITFTDGPADPNRRLFAMYRTLDDIPSLPSLPTPTLAATVTPLPSRTPNVPTPAPTATATAPLVFSTQGPAGRAPTLAMALQMPLIPTLILLGCVIAIKSVSKLRH